MSALSLFTDDILYICPLKEVFVRGKKCSVKYNDDKKYAARVLAICNDTKVLIKLKENIEGGARNDLDQELHCLKPLDMSYSTVSNEIIHNTGNDFIFVDKSILPDLKPRASIRSLILDSANEHDNYFDESSQFIKLEVRNSTGEIANSNPSPVHPVKHRGRRGKVKKSDKPIQSSHAHHTDLRTTWSPVERQLVLSAFTKYLKIGKFPTGVQMQDLIDSNPYLEERTVPQLRSFLHNQRKKLLKSQSEPIRLPKKQKGMRTDVSSIPDGQENIGLWGGTHVHSSKESRKFNELKKESPISKHKITQITAIPSDNIGPQLSTIKTTDTNTSPMSQSRKIDGTRYNVPFAESISSAHQEKKSSILEDIAPGASSDSNNNDHCGNFEARDHVGGRSQSAMAGRSAPEATRAGTPDLMISTTSVLESSSLTSLQNIEDNDNVSPSESVYPSPKNKIPSTTDQMDPKIAFVPASSAPQSATIETADTNISTMSKFSKIDETRDNFPFAESISSAHQEKNLSILEDIAPGASSDSNNDHCRNIEARGHVGGRSQSAISERPAPETTRPGTPDLMISTTSLLESSSSTSLQNRKDNDNVSPSESVYLSPKNKIPSMTDQMDPKIDFVPASSGPQSSTIETTDTNISTMSKSSEIDETYDNVFFVESISSTHQKKNSSILDDTIPGASSDCTNSDHCRNVEARGYVHGTSQSAMSEQLPKPGEIVPPSTENTASGNPSMLVPSSTFGKDKDDALSLGSLCLTFRCDGIEPGEMNATPSHKSLNNDNLEKSLENIQVFVEQQSPMFNPPSISEEALKEPSDGVKDLELPDPRLMIFNIPPVGMSTTDTLSTVESVNDKEHSNFQTKYHIEEQIKPLILHSTNDNYHNGSHKWTTERPKVEEIHTAPSSDFNNENNQSFQEKWLATEGTIIITPSATPDVSMNREEKNDLNQTYILSQEEEFIPDQIFTTVKSSNSSDFDILLDHFHPELSVEGTSWEHGINPFKHNVIYPVDGHSTESSPSAKASVMNNRHPEVQQKPAPKIVHVETVNLPAYRLLSKKITSEGAKRRSNCVHEDPIQLLDATVNDKDLQEPLLHSTMNDLEASCTYDDGNEDRAAPFEGNKSASESDVDSKNDDNDYKPEDEESCGSIEVSDPESDDDDILEKEKQESKVGKQINITLGDDAPISAPDDRELYVDKASTSTKKHFCIYCKKLQTKFARHLESCHPLEEDVKKFVSLPAKDKERLAIIATIRKKGDYLYNTDRTYNEGKLIVCRRPNAQLQKRAEDFRVCGNCKGQYSKSVLRHHFRKCSGYSSGKSRIVAVKAKKVAARVHQRASYEVRTFIYPYMREDIVVRAIRYDLLITLYANKQCQKYGLHHHHYEMIRARLRLLGRLFLAVQVLDKGKLIKHFADMYNPRYYDTMIEAVRVVAGYLPDERTFQRPAVAANLGGLLKKVGDVLRSECIKTEQVEAQRRVEDFMKLMQEDYGTSINRVVTETQTQSNRRKEVILPSTDDIRKLHSFIKSERCKAFDQLSEEFSFEAWKQLGKMTLLALQIFNRRRPGEIERLYVDDFKSYRCLDYTVDKDAYNALSEEGKKLARRYVRFEIRGKLGRGVPVLVDNEVLSCLNLLLKHRESAGVPPNNKYLFGQPSSDKDRLRYLRACNLMREYSEKCGAEIPSALRGTQLRKHIATRCINLNLTDLQVTELATFMGHHEKIHKNIYRQPVLETDIVKISKLLKTAQGFDESDDSDGDDVIEPGNSTRDSSRTDLEERPSTSRGSFGKNLKKSFLQLDHKVSTPKRWSDKERETVFSAFKSQLAAGKIPSGPEMLALINSSSCLEKRTVAQLRTWLHSQRKKMSKH